MLVVQRLGLRVELLLEAHATGSTARRIHEVHLAGEFACVERIVASTSATSTRRLLGGVG